MKESEQRNKRENWILIDDFNGPHLQFFLPFLRKHIDSKIVFD